MTVSYVHNILLRNGIQGGTYKWETCKVPASGNQIITQRGDVGDAILQTAKENPGLSFKKIAEIVAQKMNRKSVTVCYVSSVLKRNGIESPTVRQNRELRETVWQILKDDQKISTKEMASLVRSKLNRRVTFQNVERIANRLKSGQMEIE